MFSHKQLQGKNGSEMQDMMMTKGVNWNDYPSFFKRGSYIKRVKVLKKLTIDELNKLPPKHAAITNKDLIIERREVQIIDMPKLTSVTNRVDVIFNDIKPITNGK